MNLRRIPAYILAGGRSSRFGSDKARALFQGQPLIARQAALLSSRARHVIVVARRAGQYQDLGLTTIADLQPDQGPIGGLRTALAHHRESNEDGWLMLSCCDLVILQSAWLLTLVAAVDEHPDADAIVFRDQRWQPFPGLYHTRSLEREQTWRHVSFQRALDSSFAHPLNLPHDWPILLQANTPQDLHRIEADAAR